MEMPSLKRKQGEGGGSLFILWKRVSFFPLTKCRLETSLVCKLALLPNCLGLGRAGEGVFWSSPEPWGFGELGILEGPPGCICTGISFWDRLPDSLGSLALCAAFSLVLNAPLASELPLVYCCLTGYQLWFPEDKNRWVSVLPQRTQVYLPTTLF